MAPQPQSSVSFLAISCTLSLGVLLAIFWFPGFADATQSNGVTSSNALSVSTDIDTNWRYTKFGWQNASNWVSPKAYVPRQTIELLHPLVWAGIVLISVLATMIWASSEWDFARLFSHDDEATEPLQLDRD